MARYDDNYRNTSDRYEPDYGAAHRGMRRNVNQNQFGRGQGQGQSGQSFGRDERRRDRTSSSQSSPSSFRNQSAYEEDFGPNDWSDYRGAETSYWNDEYYPEDRNSYEGWRGSDDFTSQGRSGNWSQDQSSQRGNYGNRNARPGYGSGNFERDFGSDQNWSGDRSGYGRGSMQSAYRGSSGSNFSSRQSTRGSSNDRNFGSSSLQGAYNQGMSTGYGQTGYGQEGRGSFGEFGDQSGERDFRSMSRMPKNYSRSDERLREEIHEQIYRHGNLDAANVDVQVKSGEVVLTGTVESKYIKRTLEDLCESVFGVKDVRNELRVQSESEDRGMKRSEDQASSSINYGKSERSGGSSASKTQTHQ